MGRRYKLKGRPRHYVERDRRGRFKKFTEVGKGIRQDAVWRAKHVPRKPGHGHVGDYQSSGKKRKPE